MSHLPMALSVRQRMRAKRQQGESEAGQVAKAPAPPQMEVKTPDPTPQSMIQAIRLKRLQAKGLNPERARSTESVDSEQPEQDDSGDYASLTQDLLTPDPDELKEKRKARVSRLMSQYSVARPRLSQD